MWLAFFYRSISIMNTKIKNWLFIAITGLLTMLICTKSSPLYPTNDWVDANCYMTIGRGILAGRMPYRDLFDHKGPLIYLLHAAAAIISDTSFMGVFIFEIIACTATLWLFYVLLKRYVPDAPVWSVPVISVLIYSSESFCHGDSAEEFCLPLILGVMIIWLDIAENKDMPCCQKLILSGVMIGLIFWTKFNLLGTLMGAFTVISVISAKKGIINLLRSCGYTVIGVIAATIPIMIFFGIKGALNSLWEVYFYDNLFAYGGEKTPVLRNLSNGAVFCLRFFPMGCAVIFAGITSAVFLHRKRYAFYVLFSLFIGFLGCFAGHLSYKYYPFVIAPCVVFFAVPLIEVTQIIFSKKTYTNCISLAVCTISAYILSPNTYLMKYRYEDMPQCKFARIIAEYDDPVLLNYGFLDGGFYLAAGIIPEERFFCRNNMALDEMIESQKQSLISETPDFVVIRSKDPDIPDMDELAKYRLIESSDFKYYDDNFYYFLFVKK